MSENNGKKKKLFKGERTGATIIISTGLLIFLAAIITDFTAGYTAIIAVVSAMATYELIKAVGVKLYGLTFVACAVSAFTVCAVGFKISVPNISVLYCFYMLYLLAYCVMFNEKMRYTDSVMVFFASVFIPYSLSCFIRLNNISDINPKFGHIEGIYLVMMAFSCSWLTDVFAFLVGRKIGKHKMCPKISPKKSFEGAIFGTLLTAVFNVFLLFVYNLVYTSMGNGSFMGESNMKYLAIIPISIALSVVSMFGDLAASVLKRNEGIKDFSNLLPGHGGIIDRFDSCLFVLPVLYGIFELIYK